MQIINVPVPGSDRLLPSVQDFLDAVNTRFADDRFGETVEKDFRDTFTELAEVFADWRHLSVKRVKGATYPVPYTDNLGLVPADYRILGMQVVAVNGVDSATGGAGVTAPPVYYTLLRDSLGDVQALLDGEATTTLTVKARWVRTSGTEEEKMASFPGWVEKDHAYAAGDVFKYTFDGLMPAVTRLFEVLADMNLTQNPSPTGLDSDAYYKPFAPLVGNVAYDDTALKTRVTATEDVANQQRLRLDMLEANVPEALDTLAEIAAVLGKKADLSFGKVPYGQLPQGLVEVKSATGQLRYYTGFLDYLFNGIVAEQDVVRFGPGLFDDSNYNRIILSKSISIILSAQTVWKVNELLPYAGYTTPGKDLFNIDGGGTGQLKGHLLWYSDSGSASENRVVDLRNLVHEGTIHHDWAGGPRLSLSPIKLRLTNVVSTTTGSKNFGNTTQGCYILSYPQYGSIFRPLHIEARNCKFTVENGPVVQHIVSSSTPAQALLTVVRMTNCEAYLSNAYQGDAVVIGPLDSRSTDYHNVRVKTPGSDTGLPSPVAPPTKLQIRSTNTNRVFTLRIDEAVTLTAIVAIAANNSSGASFQVNKYESSGWVAGTERTTLATAQVDIAALTATDFASGAELLIKTIPVTASAEAYIFLEFTYGT